MSGMGEASGVGQPGTRGLNKRRPSRAAAIKSPHSAAPARENCEILNSRSKAYTCEGDALSAVMLQARIAKSA